MRRRYRLVLGAVTGVLCVLLLSLGIYRGTATADVSADLSPCERAVLQIADPELDGALSELDRKNGFWLKLSRPEAYDANISVRKEMVAKARERIGSN